MCSYRYSKLLSVDEVLQTIKEAGFQIPLQKVVHLTEKQAEEFYSESNYQPFFGNLTDYMSR